jgi:KDO2-lipid IV(A) lauroyltransferase
MIILVYLLQSFFRMIFFLLPPGAAVAVMRLASQLVFQIARRTPIKKIVANNLVVFFPESDCKHLADLALRNTALLIFEILCTPFFKKVHLNLIVEVVGGENLDLALAERKGALIVTMHTGNYELIATGLAGRGYHFTSILKAPLDDPLFKLLYHSRSHMGVHIINVLAGNMYREALQALSRNRVVGTLIDTGALEGRHEMFNFIGKQLPVATGWLTLAQRSGAPIVPVICKREGDKIKLIISPPHIITGQNREAMMKDLGLHFERFIASHPDQWLIFLNQFEIKRMLEAQ